MQRADSVMSIPETPIPHHFPQGREREKVEEWILSLLCKAERTPNEYIFVPVKVTMCFGYGRLACYQVVWLSWTGNLVCQSIAIYIYIYIYTSLLLKNFGALISSYLHIAAIVLLYLSYCFEPCTCMCFFLNVLAFIVLSYIPPQSAGNVSECTLTTRQTYLG